MKLGTVVYNDKIYNLDYMTKDEMLQLLKNISKEKKKSFTEAKKIVKK